MTSKIIWNLYLGDDSDASRFCVPSEPIQLKLDLREWNAEDELGHDDFSTIENAVKIIAGAHEDCIPILVYCHGGMDRSPFVVACYLLELGLFDIHFSAYERVKKYHPQTIIHQDWFKKYIEYTRGCQSPKVSET